MSSQERQIKFNHLEATKSALTMLRLPLENQKSANFQLNIKKINENDHIFYLLLFFHFSPFVQIFSICDVQKNSEKNIDSLVDVIILSII